MFLLNTGDFLHYTKNGEHTLSLEVKSDNIFPHLPTGQPTHTINDQPSGCVWLNKVTSIKPH